MFCRCCIKRKKKAKNEPKQSNRVGNITHKQMAQYIVVDIENLEAEEKKMKSYSNLMTNMKSQGDSINRSHHDIDRRHVASDEGEYQKFEYNFMEAPPPHFNLVNVLNEEGILKAEEIKIEEI